MLIVYQGKLVERRYKGALPLCIVPDCQDCALYYEYDNGMWSDCGYEKFCRFHKEEEQKNCA